MTPSGLQGLVYSVFINFHLYIDYELREMSLKKYPASLEQIWEHGSSSLKIFLHEYFSYISYSFFISIKLLFGSFYSKNTHWGVSLS